VLLAARLGADLVSGATPRARRVVLPVVAAVLAVAVVPPLAASLRFDRDLSGRDTREIAREWIEENVPAGALFALENYTAPLVREDRVPHYRAAGLDPVAYRVMRLKLPAPGTPDRKRDLGFLRRQGVEYVIVSSTVYDRVRAAPDVYSTAAAFYEALERRAELVREFRPGEDERGPVLRLYRLTPPD
jgi:hypothetical protein